MGTPGPGLLSVGSLLHEACSAHDVEGRFRTRTAFDAARSSVLLSSNASSPDHPDKGRVQCLTQMCCVLESKYAENSQDQRREIGRLQVEGTGQKEACSLRSSRSGSKGDHKKQGPKKGWSYYLENHRTLLSRLQPSQGGRGVDHDSPHPETVRLE